MQRGCCHNRIERELAIDRLTDVRDLQATIEKIDTQLRLEKDSVWRFHHRAAIRAAYIRLHRLQDVELIPRTVVIRTKAGQRVDVEIREHDQLVIQARKSPKVVDICGHGERIGEVDRLAIDDLLREIEYRSR